MSNAWNVQDAVLSAELQAYIDKLVALPENWHLHLYTNDYTPVPGEVLGAYTEAVFAGYAIGTVLATSWGAVSVASHVASTTSTTTVSSTKNDAGSVTIYGYYITKVDDTTLRMGERFGTPIVLAQTGTIGVQPIYRTQNADE